MGKKTGIYLRGPKRTHCMKGHEMTQDNVYTPLTKPTHRECLTCHKLTEARRLNIEYYGGNREIAIQRDGEKCVDCGMTRVEHIQKYERDITVNHIDGKGTCVPRDQRNNSLDNLETLCLPCHSTKDGIIRWQTNPRKLKTHCKYGHEYLPDSFIYEKGTNTRTCKQCNRDRALAYYRRNK